MARCTVLDIGGSIGLKFPAHGGGLKFYAVLQGEAWVSIADENRTTHLRPGDSWFLGKGKPFTLANSAKPTETLAAELAIQKIENGRLVLKGGNKLVLLGVAFQFESNLAEPLFAGLPPIVVVKGMSKNAATLRSNLEHFAEEYRSDEAGRTLMLNHLAPMILLQALRSHLATNQDSRSWLSAFSHPGLAKAIEAMYANCAKAWTVESLADKAGMSRATFALKFKEHMGVSPMDYLTRWRMQSACSLLTLSSKSLAEIATEVGYETESAFSVAFNRVMKCRPGYYQKQRRSAESLSSA